MILLAAIAVLLAAPAPGPKLSGRDLVLLLEIGVSEHEIESYAAGLGGFAPLDVETHALVEALHPSGAFLERLPRSSPDFGTISALARTSDVCEDAESGLGFVHPAGWVVTRRPAGRGGTILRIAPRSAAEPRVFVSPCLFVFVQGEHGLASEAAGAAADGLRQVVADRLRSAGLRPSCAAGEQVDLFGAARPSFCLEAPIDGGNLGVFQMAFALDGTGRAVGVGYTAAAADRLATAEAFRQLARSLVVR